MYPPHLLVVTPSVSFKCSLGLSFFIFKTGMRDFPGSPVVKTCPSNAASAGSILGQGAKILHASQSRNQNIHNRSNIATNSIKIL